MTQQVADAFGAAIAEHPEDWHMLQRLWLADLDPARARSVTGTARREGRDRLPLLLGRAGRRAVPRPRPGRGAASARGHEVSVLAPADDDTPLPPYVVPAGRAVPVPYNGSVARVNFGPLSAARVRRWLREGEFDVLHIHEPATPSLSLLACWAATGRDRGDVPHRPTCGRGR